MKTDLDFFASDIKRSLPSNGLEPENISKKGTRYYFSNEDYGEPLKKCFDLLGIKSKEFQKVPGHNNLKICSVSSSARLCFLFFRKQEQVEFEYSLPNPTGNGNPAQLDAKTDQTYFECKCQEIVDGEKETLSEKYISKLKKYFGLNKLNINTYEKTISAYLQDLNIDYNEDYDKTHFNVKQLFTHLISLAEEHQLEGDKAVLQYVFFTPAKENQSDSTKRVYVELNAEIKAIWGSEALKFFKRVRPNIELPEPMFIQVSEPCFADNPKDILKDLSRKG